jgi:chorismate dehydratase
MIFGKIDYINLLPFHLFLKKTSLQSSFKQAVERNKSVPSVINHKFKKRRVDAAFISSIESQTRTIAPLSLGIVARKHVKSVLVKRGEAQADPASATSNVLACVLGIEGEVFIGDRALRLYLENPSLYVDLAQEWRNRFGVPFVFARLCVSKHHHFFKKLTAQFKKCYTKIPYYILQAYAKERGIGAHDIKEYLSLITYTIEAKEQKGLKLFFKKADQLKKRSLKNTQKEI